jgi:hypothetical protein
MIVALLRAHEMALLGLMVLVGFIKVERVYNDSTACKDVARDKSFFLKIFIKIKAPPADAGKAFVSLCDFCKITALLW